MAPITSSIKPIVLAAGDSVRMGFPKALLPLCGGTFLTRILDTLEETGLENPIVVLGKHAAHITPHIAGRPARILVNEDPSRGQISSVQLAVQNLPSECGGCLVWPVDQPMISALVVQELIGLFYSSEALIAYPTYSERRGHPVIFHHSLFWELLHCPVESGARSVLMKHLVDTIALPTMETGTVADIDTPEDYFNLTGQILDSNDHWTN